MTEAVDHPKHYQHASGIECWQLSAYMPHPLASALEYVWRYEDKNGVEDLKKARWWLQCWISIECHSQQSPVCEWIMRARELAFYETTHEQRLIGRVCSDLAEACALGYRAAKPRIERAISDIDQEIAVIEGTQPDG